MIQTLSIMKKLKCLNKKYSFVNKVMLNIWDISIKEWGGGMSKA